MDSRVTIGHFEQRVEDISIHHSHASIEFQVVSSLSFRLLRGRDRVEIATSDDSDDGVGFRVDDDEVSK